MPGEENMPSGEEIGEEFQRFLAALDAGKAGDVGNTGDSGINFLGGSDGQERGGDSHRDDDHWDDDNGQGHVRDEG